VGHRVEFNPTLREIDHVFLSLDGSRAVVGSNFEGGAIQVWDIASTPKKVRDIVGRVQAVSAGGERAIRTSDNSPPQVVNVDDGAVVTDLPFSARRCFFVSPTIVLLQKATYDKATKDFSLTFVEFDTDERKSTELFSTEQHHFDVPVVVLPKARKLYLPRPKSGRVEVWDLETRKQASEIVLAGQKSAENWSDLDVSEDGKWLVVRADSATLLYEASTGKAIDIEDGHLFAPRLVPGRPIVLGYDTRQMPDGTFPYRVRMSPMSGFWAFDIDQERFTACLQTERRTYFGRFGNPQILAIAVSGDGRTATAWERSRPSVVRIWDSSQIRRSGPGE
jgi:WD40 repeat protein